MTPSCQFLWRQRSRAPLRDHFVRRLSVRLSHFWFAFNFFTFRDRAFIFGMCVPYDKTFPMEPFHIWHVCSLWQDLSDGTMRFDHVTLTMTFDLHFGNLSLPITVLPLDIRLSYLACVFLMTRPFWWYHKFWSCDLDPYLWPTFGKLKLNITLLPLDIEFSYWAGVFFMTRPFRWDYKFWSHDLHRDLWPTFEKTLTLHITFLL